MDSYVRLLGDLWNRLPCCRWMQSSIGFLGAEKIGCIGRRGGGKEKEGGILIDEDDAGLFPIRIAGSFNFSRLAFPR